MMAWKIPPRIEILEILIMFPEQEEPSPITIIQSSQSEKHHWCRGLCTWVGKKNFLDSRQGEEKTNLLRPETLLTQLANFLIIREKWLWEWVFVYFYSPGIKERGVVLQYICWLVVKDRYFPRRAGRGTSQLPSLIWDRRGVGQATQEGLKSL